MAIARPVLNQRSRTSSGALEPDATGLEPTASCLVLIRRLLCAAALFLGLAGCSAWGPSQRGPMDGLRLFPSKFGSKSSDRAFVEAVENDPFLRADQADFQVGVRQ